MVVNCRPIFNVFHDLMERSKVYFGKLSRNRLLDEGLLTELLDERKANEGCGFGIRLGR